MIVVDAHSGGLGDTIVLSWIAEGARAAGVDMAFSRGPTPENVCDRTLRMFGQRLVDDPGINVHADGGFMATDISVRGNPIPRTRLWQSRISSLSGTPLRVEPMRPDLILPTPAVEWAMSVRRTLGRRPIAVLFPFAAWKMRSWPLHKYKRLADRLESEGWATLALHPQLDGRGSDGREQGSLSVMPRHLCPKGIEYTAALCRLADIAIGGGSGGVHLSATIGVPTFAVLGSDSAVIAHGYCPEYHVCQVGTDRLPCSGCAFDSSVGFDDSCNLGCESLEMLSWLEVLAAIHQWKDRRDHVPVLAPE